jgi:hypothetical protein
MRASSSSMVTNLVVRQMRMHDLDCEQALKPASPR